VLINKINNVEQILHYVFFEILILTVLRWIQILILDFVEELELAVLWKFNGSERGR
jgi:hypothetical protein